MRHHAVIPSILFCLALAIAPLAIASEPDSTDAVSEVASVASSSPVSSATTPLPVSNASGSSSISTPAVDAASLTVIQDPVVTLSGNLTLWAADGNDYYSIADDDPTAYAGTMTIVSPDSSAGPFGFSIDVASGDHMVVLAGIALASGNSCISIAEGSTLQFVSSTATLESSVGSAISGDGAVLVDTRLETSVDGTWTETKSTEGQASLRMSPATSYEVSDASLLTQSEMNITTTGTQGTFSLLLNTGGSPITNATFSTIGPGGSMELGHKVFGNMSITSISGVQVLVNSTDIVAFGDTAVFHGVLDSNSTSSLTGSLTYTVPNGTFENITRTIIGGARGSSSKNITVGFTGADVITFTPDGNHSTIGTGQTTGADNTTAFSTGQMDLAAAKNLGVQSDSSSATQSTTDVDSMFVIAYTFSISEAGGSGSGSSSGSSSSSGSASSSSASSGTPTKPVVNPTPGTGTPSGGGNGGGSSTLPKTGDGTLLIAMLALLTGGMGALVILRRRSS